MTFTLTVTSYSDTGTLSVIRAVHLDKSTSFPTHSQLPLWLLASSSWLAATAKRERERRRGRRGDGENLCEAQPGESLSLLQKACKNSALPKFFSLFFFSISFLRSENPKKKKESSSEGPVLCCGRSRGDLKGPIKL